MNKLLKAFVIFSLLISHSTLIKAQNRFFNEKQLIANGRVWDIVFEDLNNDNNPDIFIVFNGLNNFIYLNDKDEYIS